MFERPQAGERAVLVHLDIGELAADEELSEFRLLAAAAGAEVITLMRSARQAPDPKFYVGSGKAREIKSVVEFEEADLVLFDNSLSPAQERNLEREFGCRVVDRTGLILDIFAQRARSAEGKLQVELAQLEHLSTRLVRGWTHLERQRGGIGLRGPGETQLETDRRLIGKRISHLEQRLGKVSAQRNLSRRSRAKAEVPTLSLVGYTNAGKSTLFNRLTESGVYVADKLFATLDPTLRRLKLPQGQEVILADTVGFISQLPHELVAAFRSTLQETSSAQLLLHVIDASSPRHDQQIQDVEKVLGEIGAADIPQIQVFNKLDRLPETEPRLDRDEQGQVTRVWISAVTGQGLDLLRQALGEAFQRDRRRRRLVLSPLDGRLRARLFEAGQVLEERITEDGGWELEIELDRRDLEQLKGYGHECSQPTANGVVASPLPDT